MQKLRGLWLLVALAALWLPTPAAAQIRVPSAGQLVAADLDLVLRKAEQFESQERWGDALTVYEEALRDFPDDATLGNRHNLAKIHYDLGRRYNDSSFLASLSSISPRQAVSLYSEVLTKIETHYVTAPDWQSIVARGTQDLQIALAEKQFQNRHLAGRPRSELDAFAATLARSTDGRAVRTRQQAVDAVSAAASGAQARLGLSPTVVALEYTCAAIGALDTYSSYLTGAQLNDVYSQIEGNFVGLGIELKSGTGALVIVKVITGSPAERAGIRAGDRITEVDGKTTTQLSTDEAADLLQGPEGSVVRLMVVDANNQSRRLTVRREHVEVPSVDDVKIVDRQFGVGYLKLVCFQKTTARDLDAALWKLHREGMRSLIMDLRGNPGGLLTSSVEVADKFIDSGVIVSTRGRSPLEDFNYSAHKAGTWRVPLVVLIDGDSASASEIFAGAIRDHRRGDIVGQRSYGKGSVQGIFPLSAAGAGVRLTTARFYSPSGRPISHVGIEPHIVVRQTARVSDSAVAANDLVGDSVLGAGLEAARRQTDQRQAAARQ
jgi:carboxyl-terminal processing protease